MFHPQIHSILTYAPSSDTFCPHTLSPFTYTLAVYAPYALTISLLPAILNTGDEFPKCPIFWVKGHKKSCVYVLFTLWMENCQSGFQLCLETIIQFISFYRCKYNVKISDMRQNTWNLVDMACSNILKQTLYSTDTLILRRQQVGSRSHQLTAFWGWVLM
jgi:hypothetical protein